MKEIRLSLLTRHSLQDANFLGTDRDEICEDFMIKGGNACPMPLANFLLGAFFVFAFKQGLLSHKETHRI